MVIVLDLHLIASLSTIEGKFSLFPSLGKYFKTLGLIFYCLSHLRGKKIETFYVCYDFLFLCDTIYVYYGKSDIFLECL